MVARIAIGGTYFTNFLRFISVLFKMD